MGSQSRRFRASETVDSELVYLFSFLFLCLGFLSRPAENDHTYQLDYRGAWNLEQGPSEILATANSGAFGLGQGISEVIALANSASDKFRSIGNFFPAVNFLSQEERELANMTASIQLCRNKLSGPLKRGVLPYFKLAPNETRFLETRSWSKSLEITGKKKMCKECFSETWTPYHGSGISINNDIEHGAKVIFIILVGIITFPVIILLIACKRIRDLILLKSNNELDALIVEESDLDESHLADQVLYENLLKEAELVSEGSSGKVFKVRCLELECAMKVFHSNAKTDFRKESITALNLSHPHVVKFFCCFRKPFIIMELMDEDLYSFITKIRERRINYDLPLEVALDVMLQIAEGMSYLHRQGIAHQDLKSLNILLKLRGEFDDPDFQIIAKVADFGSARRFNPRNSTGFVLFPNMNIGTRSWRAPELFHPRGGFWTRFLGVNPRVLPKPLDAYGFAIICSELLTKQIPFSNDKDLRVAVLASKLREGHRPALPSTGCPEGLLVLIKDCWHQDPALRPEFHEVCTRLIEVKSSWMTHGQRPES